MRYFFWRVYIYKDGATQEHMHQDTYFYFTPYNRIEHSLGIRQTWGYLELSLLYMECLFNINYIQIVEDIFN